MFEGAETVLGVAWLASRGPMEADFSIPQITIQDNDQKVTLRGEPNTFAASSITIHHLFQTDVIASMHNLLFDH